MFIDADGDDDDDRNQGYQYAVHEL